MDRCLLDSYEYRRGYEDGVRDEKNRNVCNAMNNKYRWHNLKEYPADLPDFKETEITYGDVLVCTKNQHSGVLCYKKDRYSSFSNMFMNTPPGIVIAWRYIEPFEGR